MGSPSPKRELGLSLLSTSTVGWIALDIHAARKALPEPLCGIGECGMHIAFNLKMSVEQVNVCRGDEAHRSGTEVRLTRSR